MDSISAFGMGQAARAAGAKVKVFDWDKAAQILRDEGYQNAEAGLQSDLEWTGGAILTNGRPNFESYTYLASVWATPVLIVNGEEIECWRFEEDSPKWDSSTKWPDSALFIFRGKVKVNG